MVISRNDELKYCTPIKAILMLFVVFYHSMAMYGDGGWGPFQPAAEVHALAPIVAWLNSFHIYAFTLISGYIFYYIKYEKGGYQEYRSFFGEQGKAPSSAICFCLCFLGCADICSLFRIW